MIYNTVKYKFAVLITQKGNHGLKLRSYPLKRANFFILKLVTWQRIKRANQIGGWLKHASDVMDWGIHLILIG